MYSTIFTELPSCRLRSISRTVIFLCSSQSYRRTRSPLPSVRPTTSSVTCIFSRRSTPRSSTCAISMRAVAVIPGAYMPQPIAMPTPVVVHRPAAVVRPTTPPRCTKITPAPRKPIPAAMLAATRETSTETPAAPTIGRKPYEETSVISAAPSETIMCVREPAPFMRVCRSTPISRPQTAATISRTKQII